MSKKKLNKEIKIVVTNHELLEGTRREMDKEMGPTGSLAYIVSRRGKTFGI
jgi:hypothetical protein